ncbi:MAG: glycoside hydrolase family 3 C-terminal domain-containing protein [Lachnospiraceae bacterium]|nr:glycoside hydrolase family 3 C-terminal domain-containing protein [Lachnospiraceae bacterium]
MSRKQALWQGLTNIFVFLCAFAILASIIMEANRTAVDGFFGSVSEALVSEEGETYKTFVPDAKYLNADGTGNATALITGAIDLGRRLEAEGAVLLKNNGALPLAKGSSVTLLGARSHITLINSGMGQKSQGCYITLEQALSATRTDFANTKLDKKGTINDYDFSALKYGGDGAGAGAGFKLNPTTIAAYEACNATAKLGTQDRANKNYSVKEPSLADLEAAAENGFAASFSQFKDAAIIVVGRGAGESNDYWKGGLNASEKTETITEPLQLTQNELDIINLATEKFDKVIVLLNNNSAIEVGELKNNDKIDAILWIGNPGNYGTLGVADILCGNVSPSGGLYDIYATKNLSTPSMMNMGEYSFSNTEEITRSKSRYYVIEAEGLYVG